MGVMKDFLLSVCLFGFLFGMGVGVGVFLQYSSMSRNSIYFWILLYFATEKFTNLNFFLRFYSKLQFNYKNILYKKCSSCCSCKYPHMWFEITYSTYMYFDFSIVIFQTEICWLILCQFFKFTLCLEYLKFPRLTLI